MLFPDFAKRKPVFYAFSCRNNANFTILVHVELHERAFLSPFPSSDKNSNRFSIRQNIFSHSMTAPNIFPAIFHLFSSFFSTHFRAFFPIFSPDSLHFPFESPSNPLQLLPNSSPTPTQLLSNSSFLPFWLLPTSSPLPLYFLSLSSYFCPFHLHLLYVRCSMFYRTTIGQQSDNSLRYSFGNSAVHRRFLSGSIEVQK